MVHTLTSSAHRGQRGQRSPSRRSRSVPGSRSRPGPSWTRRDDRAAARRQRRMSGRVSHLIAGWRTELPRPVLILQMGNLINYLGYGLIAPFEIIYLSQIRGFSTSTAGLVLAATMGTAAVITPPTGAWADRYSAKAIVIAGSLARALGYAGIAYIDQPWQAFACAIVAGIGNGTAGTAGRALVVRLVTREQRAA